MRLLSGLALCLATATMLAQDKEIYKSGLDAYNSGDYIKAVECLFAYKYLHQNDKNTDHEFMTKLNNAILDAEQHLEIFSISERVGARWSAIKSDSVNAHIRVKGTFANVDTKTIDKNAFVVVPMDSNSEKFLNSLNENISATFKGHHVVLAGPH